MSPLPPSPSTPDSGVALPETGVESPSSTLHRWVSTFSSRFGWGMYTFLCFLLFLFLTFPMDVVLQRVIASATRDTPVRIRYADGALTWRGRALIQDVTIEQTLGNVPALKLTRLTVQPSWLGLLFGSPFPLGFQAHLYGGTIEGTVAQHDAELNMQVRMQRINLSLVPVPPPGKSGAIKGLLTGSADLRGDASTLSTLHGALDLRLTEGALLSGALGQLPVPPLQSLNGTVQTTLRDGRLTVSHVTLNGDGIEAVLQGIVTLTTPLPHSGLDLQLTTRTVGTPPPTLTLLTSLLPPSPTTPGERRATISGSLAAPVLR